MAVIKFDEAGQRLYETGVDHCLLFVKDGTAYNAGVAWNGVISISENPEGAEANDLYADNKKYLSLLSAETFGLSLECYMYPDAFAACDGSSEYSIPGSGSTAATPTGLHIGQQTRKSFGLAYRTKMGNDSDLDAYKLHIVYGCKASPSERSYETVNDSPDAQTMSFDITCTPEACSSGVAANEQVYHMEICSKVWNPTGGTDSKGAWEANPYYVQLENKLYGTASAEPVGLALPDDLVAWFAQG